MKYEIKPLVLSEQEMEFIRMQEFFKEEWDRQEAEWNRQVAEVLTDRTRTFD